MIFATNQNLKKAVEEGKFREDLYYRLNVFPIKLPALRERKEDIPELTYFFLKKYSELMNKEIEGISSNAMDFLLGYDFPGNVRELENTIERAIVIGKSNEIILDDLSLEGTNDNYAFADDAAGSLEDVEKKYIIKVLGENKWNISKSAEFLGVERVTLYYKIGKYGLKKIK